MEILSVKDVSFTYPNANIPALDGVSFLLGSGELAVLCGPSGCGKSTLLRQLKPAISPHGTQSGEIFFERRRIGELDEKESCSAIGFVGQSPENQIVTDKVWHELAFGLESLGMDNVSIRRRIAETASFFGIQSWFDMSTAKLSGGQKQLLCLASVMVMRPRLLLLDEPVSQLDPIMAEEFLSAVVRINRELGTTVLLSEHRLEEILPVSDRLIVMESGRIAVNDTPKSAGMYLRDSDRSMFASMPAPMRIWAAVPDSGGVCPITVGEGKSWLESYADTHTLSALPSAEKRSVNAEPALEVKDVWFRYEKNSPDILKGISFCLRQGEMLALLGANGSGKSTLLSLLSGANRPYRGRIIKTDNCGTVGMLPQEPLALFTEKAVWEEIRSAGKEKLPKDECESRVRSLLSLCGLSGAEWRHPYDLSGGERQRAALAKILMLRPSILLLDEPTKGMDAAFKKHFAAILGRLLEGGTAIILVSHDVEFCAEYADRCALLFDGTAVAESDTREFFSDNCFYTTSAGRMARGVLPGAVTANNVISACGGDTSKQDNIPPEYYGGGTDGGAEPEFVTEPPKASSHMSLLQKISAVAGALLCAAAIICALTFEKDVFVSGGQPWISYLLIAAAVPFFAAAFARLSRHTLLSEQGTARGRRKKLPRHTVCAAAALLLAVPLTLYVGVACLGDEKYLFISLLILLEAMLPFFLIFEGRKPRARELVLVAVLCAFGFAGRGIFFMLPQVKPVIALTVITGAAFGGETGFLVGAVTMLTSNIIFQEGVFTPWQMFAMGMVGLLAGVIYNTGSFTKSRLSICFFGFFASLGYGAVMNFAFALTSHTSMTLSALLPFFSMGLPMDIVHAVSTVIFLFFLSDPMLEKLSRIKVKYGLIM